MKKRCLSCFKEYDCEYGVCPFCGSVDDNTPVEPVHLKPGTILCNRYIVGYAVGSGGFGIVYKAFDTKFETIVAVKEFFVSRLVTRAEGVRNLIVSKKAKNEYDYRKERFLAEARNMARFSSHRNIPNVFEVFEENNTAYIVMELLEGEALNKYLTHCGGKLEVDFALMIASEVGEALSSLHECNIIHRDVAPDNIFICSGKEIKIKLMDLGAAKLADSTDNVIDIILKPGYSPPEQYDNSDNIGPWTDIYALGATLYALLTGIKPDESTNRKIQDNVVPPNEINPLVNENLSNSIMKAMAVESHLRFKNVREFLQAISGERKVVTLKKEKKRRNLRRNFGIIAACLAVVIAGIFGAKTYNSKKSAEILNSATINVWYLTSGSNETKAMDEIKENFQKTWKDKNVDIKVELKPFTDKKQYISELNAAAKNDELPTLFESSDVTEESIIDKAKSPENVIKSQQFKNCYFLKDYSDQFIENKKIPLAIEVPIAYVITDGPTQVDYTSDYFNKNSSFGDNIIVSYDKNCSELIEANFGSSKFSSVNPQKSPVLISSTLEYKQIAEKFKEYTWKCAFLDDDEVKCRFIYNWSIGQGTDNEMKGAECLLSWMLGEPYQEGLMIGNCQDGQIPVNPICFKNMIEKTRKKFSKLYDIKEKLSF